MQPRPTEQFRFQMNWRLPFIGVVAFGALTGALLYGATRPGVDPNGIPAVLGLGGVLMLFPLLLVIVQLRNRHKVVSVGPEGLEVPERLTRGVARIPWGSIQRVENRVVGRSGVTVARALWIHHAQGRAQILESDLGTPAFTRVVELVAGRGR